MRNICTANMIYIQEPFQGGGVELVIVQIIIHHELFRIRFLNFFNFLINCIFTYVDLFGIFVVILYVYIIGFMCNERAKGNVILQILDEVFSFNQPLIESLFLRVLYT